MAIELVTKYLPYVDEQFTTESKLSLVTNKDFDWTGAHTVKVYKITTAPMNDYQRIKQEGQTANISRYGPIDDLTATTQEMTLSKDRSFTFSIDKLDTDETGQQLAGASALARQNREVVIPEIDSYVFGVMTSLAGTKPNAKALSVENIYAEIMAATKALDDAEVPDDRRHLIVTPATFTLLKQNKDFMMSTDIAQEMKIKGVVAMVDGLTVIKVPEKRLPAKFGFMLAHPSATVAPIKLEEMKIHDNPQFISGVLVEGRYVYDAFVLGNKNKALYYQATV